MAQCHSWRCYNAVPTLHRWTNPHWPNVICWRCANISYDVGPTSVQHFSASWGGIRITWFSLYGIHITRFPSCGNAAQTFKFKFKNSNSKKVYCHKYIDIQNIYIPVYCDNEGDEANAYLSLYEEWDQLSPQLWHKVCDINFPPPEKCCWTDTPIMRSCRIPEIEHKLEAGFVTLPSPPFLQWRYQRYQKFTCIYTIVLDTALLWAAMDAALSQGPLLWRHNNKTIIVSWNAHGPEGEPRHGNCGLSIDLLFVGFQKDLFYISMK